MSESYDISGATVTSPAMLRDRCNPLALATAARLRDNGHIAYFAGGCVRDMLMSRTPKDFDIATSAASDDVVALFPGALATGKAFGVVRVPNGDEFFEVATFRQDHGYQDGRHPVSVSPTDPPTDAMRRDFTINALFYDPVDDAVIDYVGGAQDIRARLVRTVGRASERFDEDYLRIIRAVRFCSTLAFELDPDTAEGIRSNAAKVARISPERIRDELTRILLESDLAGDALIMLEELGLLSVILPEVAEMKGQEQPPAFHPEGDVFEHTVLMLNSMKSSDPLLAWSVLLHDVGKPPTAEQCTDRIRFHNHASEGAVITRSIMERLRFSSAAAEAVSFAVGNHMRFMEVQKMRKATLRRLVGAPTFPLELELHRLDCLASHGELDNHAFLERAQSELSEETALPPAWVSGDDLLDMGLAQGPVIGKWLRAAYDRQLEGEAIGRKDLLAWLERQIQDSGELAHD